VSLLERELTCGVGAGAFVFGATIVLTGAGLLLTGFTPVLRTRLPLLSLTFDTPYWASAEVPHAKMQKIANVNLICPRLHSDCYNRSGCPEMHPQSAAFGVFSSDVSLTNDGIVMGTGERACKLERSGCKTKANSRFRLPNRHELTVGAFEWVF
jgi:hypothetical protein